jgi:hypothetical protein
MERQLAEDALPFPPPVTVGGQGMALVGYYDHDAGRMIPGRPRGGTMVFESVESPLAPSPAHLAPLPDGPAITPPPLPPRRQLPVGRRRPRALWLLAAGLPVVAGAALLPLLVRPRHPSAPPQTLVATLVPVRPALPPPAIEPDPVRAERPRPLYLVQGVVAPDVLNLHGRPGPRGVMVARIPAVARGLRATGRRHQLGRSSWWQVEYLGRQGWVNARFLAPQDEGLPRAP